MRQSEMTSTTQIRVEHGSPREAVPLPCVTQLAAEVTVRQFPFAKVAMPVAFVDEIPRLTEMEGRHVFAVWERCRGTRARAARMLDSSPRTLRSKPNEYRGRTSKPTTEGEQERSPRAVTSELAYECFSLAIGGRQERMGNEG